MGKKYKLPLSVGFAALCEHIKAIKKTADQSGSAVTELAMATEQAVTEIEGALNEKQDVNPAVAFTIPTTGWGTDSSVSGYTRYYDVTVTGLKETDVVAVDVAPSSEDTARAANFTQTQSYAGEFRLRAKNVPAAAITAQYRIINTVAYTGEEAT